MPCPCAADAGILHDHLGMVVIGFVVQQMFGGRHHALAAGKGAVDSLARVVPKGKTNGTAFSIGSSESMIIQLFVCFGRSSQQIDFFGIEKLFA